MKEGFRPEFLAQNSPGGNGPGGRTRVGSSSSDDGPFKYVQLNEPLSVTELAQKLFVPESTILKHLFSRGIPRTRNQIVELDIARQSAVAMGFVLIEETL